MNHSLSWMFASLMKVPFYVYFGHFWAIFGTFLNLSVSRIPCLLNWITSELNQQIFSESNNILNWLKQYWIKYWMNHFLAKFKYWIESDWVSLTTSENRKSCHLSKMIKNLMIAKTLRVSRSFQIRGLRYPLWFNSISEFCQKMIHSIFDSILLYPRFNLKYNSIIICWFNSNDNSIQ